MEEYSVDDYKNVIILKNQLLTMDSDQLKNLYEDYDNYCLFLDTLCVLINVDCGFFLLRDDIISKIEEVVQLNRFQTDSDTFDILNEMIQYFNITKNYSSNRKKILSQVYFAYQEDIRHTTFEDMNDLYEAIAYDAELVLALEKHDLDSISQDHYFMSSLNYILDTVPEITQDSHSYDLLLERIDSVTVRSWPFDLKKKDTLKNTKDNFQKIKKGE